MRYGMMHFDTVFLQLTSRRVVVSFLSFRIHMCSKFSVLGVAANEIIELALNHGSLRFAIVARAPFLKYT